MEILRKIIQYIIETPEYTKKTLLAYRKILWWLLRKKGVRAFYNFLFVKLFVPVGEGGTGVFYRWLRPLFGCFSWLPATFAPYPFSVEIEITSKCDKRCIFCEHTYWKEPNIDLKFEEFKKIVSQFPNLKWVNLTGEGESFLNKDFMEMIRYLKKRDVCVYFVDSFDLLNETIAEELVDLGVDGVFMSIDGASKETYEKIKVGCKFERSLQNLKNLISIKQKKKSLLPEISFRYIVCKLNLHEIIPFIELVHSLGGKKVLGPTSDIEFAGVLKFEENENLYIEEVPEDIVKKAKETAVKLNLSIRFAHATKLPHIKYCHAWLQPYIMLGGYVLPCCAVLQNNNRDFLRKYALGNIYQDDFKNIWYSKQYKYLRTMVPRAKGPVPFLCKGCRVVNLQGRV